MDIDKIAETLENKEKEIERLNAKVQKLNDVLREHENNNKELKNEIGIKKKFAHSIHSLCI